MVGFRDLVGVGIAPVSKKTAVKCRLFKYIKVFKNNKVLKYIKVFNKYIKACIPPYKFIKLFERMIDY